MSKRSQLNLQKIDFGQVLDIVENYPMGHGHVSMFSEPAGPDLRVSTSQRD